METDGTGDGQGVDSRALPWWPAERTERGGRDPLTRRRIVEAALRVIDADGLDALSMRRLGLELGSGATSLYWHVANKDQLLDLVLDEILGEVGRELRGGGDWREQLADAARAMRRVLMRHPNTAVLLGERPTIGPNALDAVEEALARLAGAGFDLRLAMMAVTTVVNFAAGWAVFECRQPRGSLAEGRTPEELGEVLGAMLRALPPERYPSIVASAAEIVGVGPSAQFEFALGALLDGIALARDHALVSGAGADTDRR